MKRVFLALLATLYITSSFAQSSAFPPRYSVPIGPSQQKRSWDFAQPGTLGDCLLSQGPSTKPAFKPCGIGSNIFTPENYGTVVGNGVADDSTAILAALAALTANGGGVLLLSQKYGTSQAVSGTVSGTKIVFTGKGELVAIGSGNLYPVVGAKANPTTLTQRYLTVAGNQNARQLTFNSVAGMAVGQLLRIDFPNSLTTVTTSSLTTRIESIAGSVVGIQHPLPWAVPTSLLTTTINIGTSTLTSVAHGLYAGQAVYLTTTGALPTGLTPGTVYYVVSGTLTADTFQLSATYPGGSAITLSGTQSGVHTTVETFSGITVTTPLTDILIQNPKISKHASFSGTLLAGVSAQGTLGARIENVQTTGMPYGTIVPTTNVGLTVDGLNSQSDGGTGAGDSAVSLFACSSCVFKDFKIFNAGYFGINAVYTHYSSWDNITFNNSDQTIFARAFKTWDAYRNNFSNIHIVNWWGAGLFIENKTAYNNFSNINIYNVREGAGFPAQGIATDGLGNSYNNWTNVVVTATQITSGGSDIAIGATDLSQVFTNTKYDTAAINEPTTIFVNWGVWDTWTPVYTCGSGAFTTTTGQSRYRKIGRNVDFSILLTVTNNGTCAGSVITTLPVAPAGVVNAFGRNSNNGKAVLGSASGSTLVLVFYDNTYPLATGESFTVSGSYEATQ